VVVGIVIWEAHMAAGQTYERFDPERSAKEQKDLGKTEKWNRDENIKRKGVSEHNPKKK